MKILYKDAGKLVIENKNLIARGVLLALIGAAIIMLVFYFLKEIEPLLWLGLLFLVAGCIGYPFLDTTVLSMDKDNQQAVLIKRNMLRNSGKAFNYADIEDFITVVVDTRQSVDDGNNESTYLRLIEKNGNSNNVFVGASNKKMEEKLVLVKSYFTRK